VEHHTKLPDKKINAEHKSALGKKKGYTSTTTTKQTAAHGGCTEPRQNMEKKLHKNKRKLETRKNRKMTKKDKEYVSIYLTQ